jgi:L-threonylcarbamoyladenylate synthase
VESVYRIKVRERGKALPVVVADIEQALALGVVPGFLELEVLEALWPAPLTVVLSLSENLPASAGSATLAVRIPAHPRTRQLLHDVKCPLTATSANRSGEPPILETQALEPLLKDRLAIIVDGGRLPGGAPSTIVEWRGPLLRVLRPGAYNPELLPTLHESHQSKPIAH